MIEPPSQPLAQALEELRLCRPADLRACRRRVKRLAHDLPAFDSVWIDALVQANKLTAFQADLLQSRDAQRLRVGPFVLEDQLGAASPESPTYLARHTSSSARCVLKIFDVAGQVADPGGEHLRSLAARGGSLQCPAVIVPHTCRVEGQQLVVVSRYVAGVDLAELVVRRGRFQPVTVAAIGRQLIQGLLSLEQAGLVHGEVRLQKVRLTPRGQAVLVDGGIRQATGRGRLIHLGHKPEQCDGVAPELVGSGQDATVVSDEYALGCLLWQLLAGRPVFPRGDPLAKLAAHRTADVPDIREWAPDVPPQMAATLIQMTASDPDHRYQSFQEVQQQWGGCRSVDRRVLARSLNRLQQGPVHTPPLAPRRRWPLVAALLLAVSGAAVNLADRGAMAGLLNIAPDWVRLPWTPIAGQPDNVRDLPAGSGEQRASQPADQPPPRSGSPAGAAASHRRPLPLPTADGVIQLESGVVYQAATVTADTALMLRCSGDTPAQIVVQRRGLRLEAPSISVSNVHFRVVGPAALPASDSHGRVVNKTAPALLLVRSDSLSLSSCRFADERRWDGRPDRMIPASIGLAWKPFSEGAASGHEVWIEDCLFRGVHMAAHLSRSPGRLQLTNCLVVRAGMVLSLPGAGPADAEIVCTQVTVRDAAAVLGLRPMGARPAAVPLTVQVKQSVIDLSPGGALVWIPESLAISGTEPEPLVAFVGHAVLASPDVALVRRGDTSDPDAVEPGLVTVEGVATSPFRFTGPADSRPRNSQLSTFQSPPRVADGDDPQRPPGIDAAALATALGERKQSSPKP